MLNYFPKYFTTRAIYLYIASMLTILLFYPSKTMEWYYYIISIVSAIGFFYFANQLIKQWSNLPEKKFLKKLFITAFSIRLIWVIISYWFYYGVTGQPFEFQTGDALHYHQIGQWLSKQEGFNNIWISLYAYWEGKISDIGYSLYLVSLYKIFGDGVLLVRIIKAILGAYTCVLVYRLTVRTFKNEQTGKMAAVFCGLMPVLIFYCGLHLKETEMVFLLVAFAERADYAMRSKKITVKNLILPILLAGSLFFFRTVLGAVAILSFITGIILTPGRTVNLFNKIILFICLISAVWVFKGGSIEEEMAQTIERSQSTGNNAMTWRAERKEGNKLAVYASKSVFAPLIFTIPFPTNIHMPGQENHEIVGGSFFVKNVMAFFVIYGMIWILFKRKWREYSFLGSLTVGYLIVLALSTFAHSGRFHLPVIPFELIFAAFGISLITNKAKKYYNFYLIFLFIAIIGWTWFKLAGRGMA